MVGDTSAGLLVDTRVWVALEKAEISKQTFIAAVESADSNTEVGAGAGIAIYTSPVVLAELKLGVELAPNSIVRQARQAALDRVLRYPLLNITRAVAMDMGVLTAYLASLGKKRQRTQDLWLAASARTHGATLLTLNARDFADIPQLQLIHI